MIQSIQVQEWKAEGRAEDRAEALLELLDSKFGLLPSEVVASIHGIKDLGTLKSWFTAATKAPSLEMFRQVAQL